METTLQTALKLHQTGQWAKAEPLYRKTVAEHPTQPDGWHLLGLGLHQHGQHGAAVEALQQAVALVEQQAQNGSLTQAASRSLAIFQRSLGLAHQGQGQLEAAETSFRQAVALNPHYLKARLSLANLCLRQERLAETVAILEPFSAPADDSSTPAEVATMLGIAHQGQGELAQAATYFAQAVQQQPTDAAAQFNLGGALQRQAVTAGLDKLQAAANCYRQAVQLEPDFVKAHLNLGVLLTDLSQFDAATHHLQQVIQREPSNAEAHYNLGNVWQKQTRFIEAIAAYEQAIHHQPTLAEAHHNLGVLFAAQDKLQAAKRAYDQAIQHQPHNLLWQLERDILAPAIMTDSHSLRAWRDQFTATLERRSQRQAVRLTDWLGDLSKSNVKFPFYTIYHGQNDRPLKEQFARLFAGPKPSVPRRLSLSKPSVLRRLSLSKPSVSRRLSLSKPTSTSSVGVRVDGDTASKPTSAGSVGVRVDGDTASKPTSTSSVGVRGDGDTASKPTSTGSVGVRGDGDTVDDRSHKIGFVVTHGHEGIFNKLVSGLLNQWQAESLDPVVVCSEVSLPKLRPHLHNPRVTFLPLPTDFASAVQRIQAEQFAGLYFWEIGTDSTNYFLPFFRLAPVQCTSWGIPATSGMAHLDYYLSSDWLESAETAAEHYTEQLVCLPSLPVYYERPVLPTPLKPRAAFGLSDMPDEAHLYLCPQSLFKLHPEFDALLAEILQRDAHGQLILLEGMYPHWKDCLLKRWRARPDAGSWLARVRFLPRQNRADFLNLMAVCDVMLDPLHYGGTNTSYEAFAVGIPIVTWPSAYLKGRITAGCYRRMGLLDCIAQTHAAYVEIALKLGTQAAYRARIRANIQAASSVLYEDEQAVRDVEGFFKSVLVGRGPSPRNNL